jgi:outer membrane receptor protein involved in Fe transport
VLRLNINNVLPNASFNYRINQGSNLSLSYNSSSQQPDLQQMQPVRDNSDPNRISLGNPDLKPTFSNNVNMNFYIYKGISDRNLWSGFNASNTYNQISNTTTYDEFGRAVTQPINVNGNYYANAYMGFGLPLFKRFMKIYLSYNTSHSNNVSFVNGNRNIAQNTTHGPEITLEKESAKYEVHLEANYDYNDPKSSLSVQSQQPYYTYKLNGNVMLKLPKKFSVTADGRYINNGNRTPGYNLNYFILDAAISKTFFKTEDLVISAEANDILNQNISNERFINSNQIVDKKTQVIRRYFLLRVLYKFNSQKAKKKEDEDD